MPDFKTGKMGDFKIRWVDDGNDYPGLLEDFLAGRIESKCLAHWPDRETYLVTAWDRKLLIKRCCPPPEKLKRHHWDLVSGYIFTRIMRETWAAKARGCDIIPEVYLAAEKEAGFNLCLDSYQIAEYLEGETLSGYQQKDFKSVPSDWMLDLRDAVLKLHKFGLASGSIHPWNLVRTPDGVKVIDLSIKGPTLISQGHDILDLKRRCNLEAAPANLAIKIMSRLVFMKYWWHVWRKNFKARFRS